MKINNTSSIQQSHSLVELSNPSTNVLLSKSKCLPDDWGSDDESHFLEIQLPKCSKHDDSQSLVIGSNKEVCDIKKNDQFVTGGNLNKDTVMEIQVRKFPGPAGVLLPLCVSICFLLKLCILNNSPITFLESNKFFKINGSAG